MQSLVVGDREEVAANVVVLGVCLKDMGHGVLKEVEFLAVGDVFWQHSKASK